MRGLICFRNSLDNKSRDTTVLTFKNYFRDTMRVSNTLDLNQSGRFVRPDLGQICFYHMTSPLGVK